MKEVKVNNVQIKAELNRTIIEDLNNMRLFDLANKIEDYLIKNHFRSEYRKRKINKIFSL